jgi:hypothetical protein
LQRHPTVFCHFRSHLWVDDGRGLLGQDGFKLSVKNHEAFRESRTHCGYARGTLP